MVIQIKGRQKVMQGQYLSLHHLLIFAPKTPMKFACMTIIDI